MLKVGEVVKGAHGQYKITGELTDNYRWKLYKAIDYTDKEFLLHCFFDNDERLKQNIYNLFTRHLPPALKSDKFFFAYPEDFIRTCEYFGFCMPYINMSDSCACGDIIFSSEPLEYEALVNVSKNIIAAFEALHNSGYCFREFSHGNIYINTKTGFVSIMDVENITTPNNRSGQSVLGTEGYIAPEIVRGVSLPDVFQYPFCSFICGSDITPLKAGSMRLANQTIMWENGGIPSLSSTRRTRAIP